MAFSNADNRFSMSCHICSFLPAELTANSCIRACRYNKTGLRFSGESSIAVAACSAASVQFPVWVNISARARRTVKRLGLSETSVRKCPSANCVLPKRDRVDANANRTCEDVLPNPIDSCQYLTASNSCPLSAATRPSRNATATGETSFRFISEIQSAARPSWPPRINSSVAIGIKSQG